MADKRDCPLCGEVLEDAPVIHDLVMCEQTERLKGRETIKKLKASIDAWKDSWFSLREIISDLWWYHPAICDDQERTYYQQQKEQRENITTD
jgi:hypothetical protein